jgi:hypothetical protein
LGAFAAFLVVEAVNPNPMRDFTNTNHSDPYYLLPPITCTEAGRQLPDDFPADLAEAIFGGIRKQCARHEEHAVKRRIASADFRETPKPSGVGVSSRS